MALAISEVRGVVERVFARQDVLDACARRDLGAVIKILGAHGVTQGRIAELTSISQGRLSEWVRRKRAPRASSTFEAFADGLGLPPAARQALGLAPGPAATSGPALVSPSAKAPPGTARPTPPGPTRAAGDGLAGLRGLDAVRGQLDAVIAVLKAEQERRNAGSPVRRPAWKNLVFTGGAGTGKSRAAAAVGQVYRDLGVLSRGHVLEAAAVDLAGPGTGETAKLLAEAIRPACGGILLVNAAHDWYGIPDHGQQVARGLYRLLTEHRNELNDDIAVILAGQADPLRRLLAGHPSLAARFQAVIDFPGYTPGQLAVIFTALAGEAGLRLTAAASRKAAALLAQAENGDGSGNARLAVSLLNQARAAQARRVAAALSPGLGLAALVTITETDIPEDLHPDRIPPDEDRPGPYL